MLLITDVPATVATTLRHMAEQGYYEEERIRRVAPSRIVAPTRSKRGAVPTSSP